MVLLIVFNKSLKARSRFSWLNIPNNLKVLKTVRLPLELIFLNFKISKTNFYYSIS